MREVPRIRVRVDAVTAPLVLGYVEDSIIDLVRKRAQARDAGQDVKAFNYVLHRLTRLKEDLTFACEAMEADERTAATG